MGWFRSARLAGFDRRGLPLGHHGQRHHPGGGILPGPQARYYEKGRPHRPDAAENPGHQPAKIRDGGHNLARDRRGADHRHPHRHLRRQGRRALWRDEERDLQAHRRPERRGEEGRGNRIPRMVPGGRLQDGPGPALQVRGPEGLLERGLCQRELLQRHPERDVEIPQLRPTREMRRSGRLARRLPGRARRRIHGRGDGRQDHRWKRATADHRRDP